MFRPSVPKTETETCFLARHFYARVLAGPNWAPKDRPGRGKENLFVLTKPTHNTILGLSNGMPQTQNPELRALGSGSVCVPTLASLSLSTFTTSPRVVGGRDLEPLSSATGPARPIPSSVFPADDHWLPFTISIQTFRHSVSIMLYWTRFKQCFQNSTSKFESLRGSAFSRAKRMRT